MNMDTNKTNLPASASRSSAIQARVDGYRAAAREAGKMSRVKLTDQVLRFTTYVDKRLTLQKRLRAKRMLQAYDGRRAGATQREIAEVIFQMPRISRDEWQSASERFAVMALLRDARKMISGGCLGLLRKTGAP